jgi:hypothetical protein
MCFGGPKPVKPNLPAEKQPVQTPKDNAIAAGDRLKDKLRAGSNTIMTGPRGSSNALTTRTAGNNILGRTR